MLTFLYWKVWRKQNFFVVVLCFFENKYRKEKENKPREESVFFFFLTETFKINCHTKHHSENPWETSEKEHMSEYIQKSTGSRKGWGGDELPEEQR